MSLGDLTVACRIETVYKIVKRSQTHSSGLTYTGIAHLDGRAVTVVDLQYKLFRISIPKKEGYFTIIKPQQGELLAIPVTTSPNLMDIPRDNVRTLPTAYRQSDTLSIASHVAIVSQGDITQTIFLLDENSLI